MSMRPFLDALKIPAAMIGKGSTNLVATMIARPGSTVVVTQECVSEKEIAYAIESEKGVSVSASASASVIAIGIATGTDLG